MATKTATIPMDGWDIDRAARFLGLSKGTLYNWSYLDHPPIPRRVGDRLIYNPQDVIDYRENTCRKNRKEILYNTK